MTDQNAKKHEAHKPSVDAASPFHAAFGAFQKDALRVADESEKMVERSMQELKRANHEGARLWESQLELQASMTRAMFDGVRRMFSV
ncbi:MAG: hypothetical protein Q8O67_06850 [Deltaproteobacteria bacterium]|nr:hypothetical protein [Deltaproteobacteria bacterium]